MYNLRNKRVNRHCTTETSCRVQASGSGTCSKSELPSPSASGRRSVTPSRATADPTTIEEHNNNSPQPALDVSAATQVNLPLTTKAGLPRKRMKWTAELNSFIMRSYFKITKMETDLTTYRYALHRAFVEKYPELQHLTEQRIADQRRAILTKNLLAAPVLQQIRAEVLLELQGEDVLPSTENAPDGDHIGVDENNTENDTNPDRDNNTQIDMDDRVTTEFSRALAEFDGTDPTRRPKLPKLRTSKTTNNIIAAVNTLLQERSRNCGSLEQLHLLVYCGAVTVLRSHNQQVRRPKSEYSDNNKSVKPWWQRRIEGAIDNIRRELSRLTEFCKNPQPSRRLKNHVKKIFKKIGTHKKHPQHQQHVCEYIDLLKQKLKAKAKRLSRYVKCTNRKQQNSLFNNNQKAFYRNLGASTSNNNQALPSKEDLTNYWSSLWSSPKQHKRNAHWIESEMEKVNIAPMPFDMITTEEVSEAVKCTDNWKAPGVDGTHNFWYKKFSSLHQALARNFTHILHHPEDTPKFLTLGMTNMLPKSAQTKDPTQYRPITCLPTLYKILTSCLTNRIYRHVELNNVLAEEQKGCKREHQGCKEQLIIDSVILKQAQRNHRNICTAFVDYKKAFDSVPHSWLVKVLEIYKIHPTIITFLSTIMKTWRTNLNLHINDKYLKTDEISIRRGIYQGDSLSPLWFCLALNPLSSMLNATKYGFKVTADRNISCIISHLLYMDDIKIYAANQQQMRQLLEIIQKFSNDIHMEFGLNKCKTLNIEKGVIIGGDVQLPNGDIIQAMENGETYKYLGFQQARMLDENQAKARIKGQFTKRVSSLLKTELNAGNLFQAVNTYATPVLTYSFGILKWTRTDLDEIQRLTRTMMTKHNCHHPKSSTLRTTLSRKDGGRGLVDIINLHSRQVSNLREFFYKKARTSNLHKTIVKADKSYSPLNLASPEVVFEVKSDAIKKEEWSQKELHGRHYYDLNQPHIDNEASNKWLTRGELFPETEGFMSAIQDQVVNTNNYKKYIIRDRNIETDKCRKCHQVSETIQHITSGCSLLANTDYLHRHNQVCNIIHQKLANKLGLINTYTPYYKYQPQKVLENDHFRLYYDRPIITDRQVTNNRPDIVVVDKGINSVLLVDIAIPNNNNILSKYQEKVSKYSDLAFEIRQMWHANKVEIVPVILSSTGLVPKSLETSLAKLGLHKNTYIDLQKAVILNTCRTVRKFLQV